MSLVGPRPLPTRDYSLLEEWHLKRYLVLPGMTGLWQISGRSNLSFDDLVRLDFYLPRQLVDLARHHHPRAHDPGGDLAAGRVLTRSWHRHVTRAWHQNVFVTERVAILPAVKSPKILAVASAIDLDFKYGCTPAWWQLWKGLHEAGVDLIVTPYRGRPDRGAVVAHRAEPLLPRGRALRERP